MDTLLTLEGERQKLKLALARNEERQRELVLGTEREEAFEAFEREEETVFWPSAASRATWLVGLLAAQSLSSFVLEANEKVLTKVAL